MTKEALKLALEALEEAHYKIEHKQDVVKREQAITAIKEALAQPEQEPVAWRAWVSKFPQGTGSDWVYVTKPIMKDSIHNQPLYTTPPPRTWIGLTEEEIKNACDKHTNWFAIALDLEAKLKEKNT